MDVNAFKSYIQELSLRYPGKIFWEIGKGGQQTKLTKDLFLTYVVGNFNIREVFGIEYALSEIPYSLIYQKMHTRELPQQLKTLMQKKPLELDFQEIIRAGIYGDLEMALLVQLFAQELSIPSFLVLGCVKKKWEEEVRRRAFNIICCEDPRVLDLYEPRKAYYKRGLVIPFEARIKEIAQSDFGEIIFDDISNNRVYSIN